MSLQEIEYIPAISSDLLCLATHCKITEVKAARSVITRVIHKNVVDSSRATSHASEQAGGKDCDLQYVILDSHKDVCVKLVA